MNKKRVLHALIISCTIIYVPYLVADQITVYNKTDQNLFVRIYYYQGPAKNIIAHDEKGNILNIIKIPANSSKKIERPPRWRYQILPVPRHYDRQLVISPDPRVLKETLNEYEYWTLPWVNIGTLHGSSFYLAQKDEQLGGYNIVDWKVVKPAIELAEKVEKKMRSMAEKLVKNYPAVQRNPYKNRVAAVVKRDLQLDERIYLETHLPYLIFLSKKLEGSIDDLDPDDYAYLSAHFFLVKRLLKKLNQNLHPGERAYLDKRLTYVAISLEKLLGREIDHKQVPKIALVASGGGYRAMISTVGSLIAAQDTGLLDVTTWMVGLSGSTWALGGWTVRGISPQKFKDLLFTKIEKKLQSITRHEIELLINALLVKVAFGQKVTVVDLYGGFLANRLLSDFGDARHRVYLSQQTEQIKNGNWVFPIYTAVRRGVGVLPTWYEFTPYEIGSPSLNLYVPTWAYGRKFVAGESMDFAPEQSLGYNFGTFGSAFAITFSRMYGELLAGACGLKKTILEFVFDKIVKQLTGEIRLAEFGQKRVSLSWAEVFNFTKGIPASPIKDKKIIKLVDAGIEFNLPYPPISGERSAERKADVIIFLDYSGDIKSSSELKKCEDYARNKGLKFPPINYTGLAEKAVSIFKDENDPAVPVVIYLPLIKDRVLWQKYRDKLGFEQFQKYLDTFDPVQCEEKDFCSTFNFQYKPKQAERLSAQTEFNLKASMDKIIEILNWAVDRKAGK